MYAVIKTGGKQYKVTEGEQLRVEKLDAEVGASIDFNEVLLVADNNEIKLGTPLVSGGKVSATVEEHGRGKKIKIIKFKRRKHHMKRMGHRQSYTEVRITNIIADGITASIEPKQETVTDDDATPEQHTETV
ncbi:MAG: 50S ribosomal protein L21 [Thiomargarita sp.]|nr:50S ribosomal protein L21 [Thiomargarita sp.]